MKRSLALLLAAFVLLLAACGGSPNTPGGNGNGGGESNAPASTEASVDSQPSEGNSGGGGGGSAGDLDALVEALTPPNASETSRYTAQGGLFVGWDSSDSVESLKSFYESAIPNAGMEVFGTSSAGGTYAWVFAQSEGSSFGGSVTVVPSTSGGSGTSVILSATSEL